MAQKPRITVSSTCRDLLEERGRLRSLIEDELGYKAHLSERPDFPVDLDAGAIENCRRRVRDDTDVLIVILGARYGHVSAAERKSVVSIEFATAQAAGVPVIAFIQKRMLTLFEAWERDSTLEFKQEIDDPALLPFIKSVRDEAWTHEFSNADELVRGVRDQVSFRVQTALALQRRLEARPDRQALAALPPDALQIALSEGPAWIARVIARLLESHLTTLGRQREDFDDEVAIGAGEIVGLGQEAEWFLSRIAAIQRWIHGLEKIVDGRLARALASKDIGLAARAATSLGEAYSAALEWARSIRCAHLDERYHESQRELARTVRNALATLDSIPRTIDREVAHVEARVLAGEDVALNLEFPFSIHNSEILADCLKRVRPPR